MEKKIINALRFHVKYPSFCAILSNTSSIKMLLKTPNIKFQGYPAGRSRPDVSGITEVYGEANTLLCSANAPKRHVFPHIS